MKVSTFRIISSITTVVAGAIVGIFTKLGLPYATVVSTVTVIVAGTIDEVCTIFIKSIENNK